MIQEAGQEGPSKANRLPTRWTCRGGRTSIDQCGCGSGKPAELELDARGIPLGLYCCDDCREERQPLPPGRAVRPRLLDRRANRPGLKGRPKGEGMRRRVRRRQTILPSLTLFFCFSARAKISRTRRHWRTGCPVLFPPRRPLRLHAPTDTLSVSSCFGRFGRAQSGHIPCQL